jgi:hypothetical protein
VAGWGRQVGHRYYIDWKRKHVIHSCEFELALMVINNLSLKLLERTAQTANHLFRTLELLDLLDLPDSFYIGYIDPIWKRFMNSPIRVICWLRTFSVWKRTWTWEAEGTFVENELRVDAEILHHFFGLHLFDFERPKHEEFVHGFVFVLVHGEKLVEKLREDVFFYCGSAPDEHVFSKLFAQVVFWVKWLDCFVDDGHHTLHRLGQEWSWLLDWLVLNLERFQVLLDVASYSILIRG